MARGTTLDCMRSIAFLARQGGWFTESHFSRNQTKEPTPVVLRYMYFGQPDILCTSVCSGPRAWYKD